MAKITLYSKSFCPYCMAAKSLLTEKGAAFDEIDIGRQPALRDVMLEKSGGRRTVPQIFINERHVGGFDDLDALNRAGGLDELLAAP